MAEAGEGEFGGAGSAADGIGSFEDGGVAAGAGEYDGGGQAIGPGSDDGGARFRGGRQRPLF